MEKETVELAFEKVDIEHIRTFIETLNRVGGKEEITLPDFIVICVKNTIMEIISK